MWSTPPLGPRNLKILHYGLGEECEYRLINYDAQNGSVEARVNGQAVRYALGAAGGAHGA